MSGSRLDGALPGRWVEEAACVGAQADESFFPPGEPNIVPAHYAAAKAICSTCLVRDACLDFALDTDQAWGVWGGLSPTERRRLAFKRRAS